MIKTKTGVSPDAAISALPTIFVEGKFDEKILKALFNSMSIDVRIKPLGHSGSIRSVAEALHKYYPEYCFIADMDHFDKELVDACWKSFPDPSSHNLLIWRKREIENYFIEPCFLAQSEFFTGKKDDLSDKICEYAGKRIFFDIVNLVIIKIRELMKEKWIDKFDKPDGFETIDCARTKLLNRVEFNQQREKTQTTLSQKNIAQLFDEYVEEFIGENALPAFGFGRWTDLIQGMELYKEVVNHSGFFSHENIPINTSFDEHIAKELVKDPKVEKPNDFIKLCDLIKEKILTKR